MLHTLTREYFFSRTKYLLATPQHGNPEDHVLSKRRQTDMKDYITTPHTAKAPSRDKEIGDHLEPGVRREGDDCEWAVGFPRGCTYEQGG